ncbi:MAG: hypothetical protein M1829_004997 [Trizodia sp. TS-e1964]|nr:MAG: hypothetical protein M1829_004997 [Trizodia sp. TS-e1964]
MHSSSNVFTWAVAFMPLAVFALPWDGAEPTPIAMSEPDALGWTPMPTGMVPAVELFKRDSPANLCGYVDGDQSDSAYCSSTLSCVFNTDVKAVGCCESTETNCAFYTKCYNSVDIKSSSCNAACAANTFIRKCSSAAYPSCYTYSYPEVGYINVGCGTRSYSSNVLTTYNGQASKSSLASISLGSGTKSSSSTTSTSTSSSSSAGSSTTDPAAASTTMPATSSSSGGSSTNIGAIAGGAVGGLAVLGIIAALIFIFCLKKPKTPPPANPNVAYNPVAPGPGMPQQMNQHNQQMPPQQNYYPNQPNQAQGFPQQGGYAAGGAYSQNQANDYYGKDPNSMGPNQNQYPQSPASPPPGYNYPEMDGVSKQANGLDPNSRPVSTQPPHQVPFQAARGMPEGTIHEAPVNEMP